MRSPLTARLTRRKTRVGVSRILLDQFSEISSRGNDGASSTPIIDYVCRAMSKVSRGERRDSSSGARRRERWWRDPMEVEDLRDLSSLLFSPSLSTVGGQ